MERIIFYFSFCVAMLAVVEVFLERKFFIPKKSEGEFRCIYFCRPTPYLRFKGKPYQVIAFERDREHIYVSVRIKNGLVMHFLMFYDSLWEGFYFVHSIETYSKLCKLDIDFKIPFDKLSEDNIVFDSFILTEFDLEDIKNYADFGIDASIFNEIKMAKKVAIEAVKENERQAKEREFKRTTFDVREI